MQEIFLIGAMALVTFGIRYFPIAISGRVKLSPKLIEALQFVPSAVLTAIVVPAVLIPTEEIYFSYANARLVGAIAAIIVAWFARSLLLTIVAGMVVFFGWQWLLGSIS